MITVDTTATIKDYEGKDTLENDSPNAAAATFKTIFIVALNKVSPAMSGVEKTLAFELSVKIVQNATAVELSPEDCAYLLKVVREQMPPLVVGRVEELLDPKN